MINSITPLLKTIDALLGPGGCPWDRKQTVLSMAPSLEGECKEVLHAIEEGVDSAIEEELGDLLFNILFIARLGEKEGRFSLNGILERVNEKFIRRHPHVFENPKELTEEELLEQWNRIKEAEKNGKS